MLGEPGMTECSVYSGFIDEEGVIELVPSKAVLTHETTRVDTPCVGDTCLSSNEGYTWYRIFIYLETPEMQHWRVAAVALLPESGEAVIAVPPGGLGNPDPSNWLVLDTGSWPKGYALIEKIPVTEEDNWTWVVFAGLKDGSTATLKAGFGHPEADEAKIVCYHEIKIGG